MEPHPEIKRSEWHRPHWTIKFMIKAKHLSSGEIERDDPRH